jgi:hypothetical protein
MPIVRASDEGTCLIDIEELTSDLQCNNYWYNDNSFNLVYEHNNTYSWVPICADYLYLYNFNEEIRNPLNPIFANAFVKETSVTTNQFRCRILSCTGQELLNSLVSHESNEVGIAIQLFCGDNITVIAEAPHISNITLSPAPHIFNITLSPTMAPIQNSNKPTISPTIDVKTGSENLFFYLMYSISGIFILLIFIRLIRRIFIFEKRNKNKRYKKLII